MGSSRPVVDELSRQECVGLLARQPVGRLAVSVDALPAVFPVNFALSGEDIVFRCAAGTKFSAATAGSVVAFEVDGYDTANREGWSVINRAIAEEVIAPEERRALADLPLESWGLGDAADKI